MPLVISKHGPNMSISVLYIREHLSTPNGMLAALIIMGEDGGIPQVSLWPMVGLIAH